MKLYNLLFETKSTRNFLIAATTLLEIRLSAIKTKLNPEQLKIFDNLFTIEPKLPQKYSQWVGNNIDTISKEGEQKTHELLTKFDTLAKTNNPSLKNKDINSPENKNFYSLVKNLENINIETSKTKQKEKVKSNSNTIFSDEKYLVIEPLSVESACYYGANTKWCISAKEENQFKTYRDSGVRFVLIIDKKAVENDPMAKVAVAYVDEPDPEDENDMLYDQYEIYDSLDQMKTIQQFLSSYPENIIQSINNFFSKKILPVSHQDEKERINAQDKEKIETLLIQYAEFMASDDQRKVEYGKQQIEHWISNLDIYQLEIANYFLVDNPKNIKYKFIDDLLVKKIKSITDQLPPEEGFYILLNKTKLWLSVIADQNLLPFPKNQNEALNQFMVIEDDKYKKLLLRRNSLLLGEHLVGKGYETYINPNMLSKIKVIFDYLKTTYQATSFRDIPDNEKYRFENAVKYNITIEPYIEYFDDIAWIMYDILIKDELSVITDPTTKKEYVFYIPKKQ